MSATKDYLAILKIEKERNEVLKELEEDIGFDVSFSDEQVMKNATEKFMKAYEKELKEKIKIWMK
tara:strand:+ start:708 stop:902 length:195 start_codon:yes stop_codon:yes gene_type:complete